MSARRRSLWFAASFFALSAIGCSPTETGGDATGAWPGLEQRAQVKLPGYNAHLGKLVTSGDVAFVANSFDAFAVFGLEPDGGVTIESEKPPGESVPRCTTIALHEASKTLFCGSERSLAVAAYDVSNPRAPILRDAAALTGPGDLYVRDLHVAGDVLYLSRFDKGLFVAAISGEGALSNLRPTPIAGDVRFVRGDGASLAALTRDRGLVVLAESGGDVTEIGALALDGPPLGLAVRDGLAAVALGSAGAAVVSLGPAPTIVAEAHPLAMVTSVALDESVLAATSTSGVFLFDLKQSPARVAGFFPSTAVDLDAAFMGGDLVVSDWWFIERLLVQPAGHAMALDLPRGTYFAPSSESAFSLRNVGDTALKASISLQNQRLTVVDLAPGATSRFVVDPALIAEHLDPTGVARISVTTLAAATRSAADGQAAWKERDVRFVSLVPRPQGADPAEGTPAIGDPFPVVAMNDAQKKTFVLPLANERFRAIFFGKDCVAMWPQLEDAAWLARRGELDDGATAVFVGDEEMTWDGFLHRWGIEDILTGNSGPTASADVLAQNAHYGASVYDSAFIMPNIVGGAQHPTDYLVDAAGHVEAVERVYYGAFPLR